MAAWGRTELLANPTRVCQECPVMRRLLAPLFAIALLLMAATSVLAIKPDRQPSALPPELDFAAGELCPIAVHVEFFVNRQKDTFFFNRDGEPVRLISSGTLRVRLTTPDEPGATLELNISGPVHLTFHADGSATLILGGRSVSTFPPGSASLVAGRSIIELDASGNFVSVTNIGNVTDLCAMLAA
jgi:hypothetical protein